MSYDTEYDDRKGKYQAVNCTVISSGGGGSAGPEADGKSVGDAARAALGRLAHVSNSAEMEEQLVEFNSLIQLHADITFCSPRSASAEARLGTASSWSEVRRARR